MISIMEHPQSPYTFVKIDFSSSLFELAKDLRVKVFVEEQGVPEENEMDEIDTFAHHFVLLVKRDSKDLSESDTASKNLTDVTNEAYECISTLRIFPYKNSTFQFKVGRVAVALNHRRKGIGSKLMNYAEEWVSNHVKASKAAEELSHVEFILHSQLDKKDFYAGLGYQEQCYANGEQHIFYEEGIPHVKMIKQKQLSQQ
jgi:predicted GNAT family N-acyltransferase